MKSPMLAFLLTSGLNLDLDGLDLDNTMNDKTASGIDKLRLMLKFMSVLDADENKGKREFGKLKSWLYSQLKRKITTEEEVSLLEGIVNYLHSEPGTPERMTAMNYLFDAKFISQLKNEEK
jgi:tRNA C32,U32 (ribose-2'-O)-methylase TrmJ